MAKKIKYKAPYIVHTWFERDRQNIWVEDAKGRNVAEWWDEDVSQMINDGFFKFTGSHGYVGTSVINYLVNMKTIEADRICSGSYSKYVLPDFSEE